MKELTLFCFLLCQVFAFSNDSIFYTAGNHLISLDKTDCSLSKEVLSIKRDIEFCNEGYEDNYLSVTVDYTFYNPGSEENVLVAFEAISPYGNVDVYPVNGNHPYVADFSIEMNGVPIESKVSIVDEENYYRNGTINSKTVDEVIDEYFNENKTEFLYVYHFMASFKSGENKIKHTYRFLLSRTVSTNYNFDYLLTTAKQWANQKIDDFTLHIELGTRESFFIEKTFFSDPKEWNIEDGRMVSDSIKNRLQFITFSGGITFTTKDFVPAGELHVWSLKDLPYQDFDYTRQNLPKKITLFGEQSTLKTSVDETSFQILKGLPYAIRGYVFEEDFIQQYYLTQKWYRPNPSYKPALKDLTELEMDWLNEVKAK